MRAPIVNRVSRDVATDAYWHPYRDRPALGILSYQRPSLPEGQGPARGRRTSSSLEVVVLARVARGPPIACRESP
jgi:hypothetical protein